ncbi:MAG: non-canonical purine NTP pyrophosphatase, RdgB/HAM1 family [Planctomycetales bacterium 4484_123]|nr:MAG: non-canonical purine NTP pyrophosphatase, RdgB/HAM1 family [Planctomycetales bacterium 4484_123]
MNASRKIVVASRNPGKVRELAQVLAGLGVLLVGLDEIDPEERIAQAPEDAASFADNARSKAVHYARALGLWALADDSGLEVDALGGAPGVRSARYAADECPAHADRAQRDAANNRKLLRALAGIARDRRTARFVCHLAVSDGRDILVEATGTLEGLIATEPAGQNGFGYDPLFFLPAMGCTAAQLPPERKNAISHRGQAARKLAERLKALLHGAGQREGPASWPR